MTISECTSINPTFRSIIRTGCTESLRMGVVLFGGCDILACARGRRRFADAGVLLGGDRKIDSNRTRATEEEATMSSMLAKRPKNGRKVSVISF